MSIHELSFTSTDPILELPYIRYEIRLQESCNSILNSLDFSTAAVEVRYSQSGKRPLIAKHIPHLLKKVYDRKDINSSSFEEQLWSIEQKVKKARDIIAFLNHNNKFFLNFQERKSLPISFSNDLRKPANLQNFNAAKLDFGNQTVVAYPNAALRRRQLREKPAEIKSVITG